MLSDFQLWAVLYLPVLVALVLACCWRIYPRLKVAITLHSFWQAVTLPWLNYLAETWDCWQFSVSSPSLLGLPINYYLGWVIWWGVVATILLGKLPTKHALWWVLGGMFLIDIIFMPLFHPQVELNSHWLVGEILLIVGGLIPGLFLSHWTLSWKRACWRSFLLSIAFGLALFTIFPLLAGYDAFGLFAKLSQYATWQHYAYLGAMFIASAPAVAGVVAFSKLGNGTPIPFDPPLRLVRTGVYSYIRNPIQWSMIVCTLIWSFYLQLPFYWAVAGVSICYCIGLAKWSEQQDLESRFGDTYVAYAHSTTNWKFSLTPAHTKEAELYVAFDCVPCSTVGKWFHHRSPRKLSIKDANSWNGSPLQRITYVYPCGNQEQGVAAIAAALQHLHIGWAFLAWIAAYPGLLQVIQLAMDHSGGSTRFTTK